MSQTDLSRAGLARNFEPEISVKIVKAVGRSVYNVVHAFLNSIPLRIRVNINLIIHFRMIIFNRIFFLVFYPVYKRKVENSAFVGNRSHVP